MSEFTLELVTDTSDPTYRILRTKLSSDIDFPCTLIINVKNGVNAANANGSWLFFPFPPRNGDPNAIFGGNDKNKIQAKTLNWGNYAGDSYIFYIRRIVRSYGETMMSIRSNNVATYPSATIYNPLNLKQFVYGSGGSFIDDFSVSVELRPNNISIITCVQVENKMRVTSALVPNNSENNRLYQL